MLPWLVGIGGYRRAGNLTTHLRCLVAAVIVMECGSAVVVVEGFFKNSWRKTGVSKLGRLFPGNQKRGNKVQPSAAAWRARQPTQPTKNVERMSSLRAAFSPAYLCDGLV
jgi:hypothetical protein